MSFKKLCASQPFSRKAGNTRNRALFYAHKFDKEEDEKVIFLPERLKEIDSPFCLLVAELDYLDDICLAVMAASVDGSYNRFVFLRWFNSGDPYSSNQIYCALKLCLQAIDACGNKFCIGGVAAGSISNDGTDLDCTILWDYRDLEAELANGFEQIDMLLRQIYTRQTFTQDNYRRTFAHYSRLIREDELMRTETKDLYQSELGKIQEVCGRYFSVCQKPLDLFNVNTNILQSAALKLNYYADAYGETYGDDDKRRLWLLAAAMEDLKFPPFPEDPPEDPPQDTRAPGPGPDRRRQNLRGLQRMHRPRQN